MFKISTYKCKILLLVALEGFRNENQIWSEGFTALLNFIDVSAYT